MASREENNRCLGLLRSQKDKALGDTRARRDVDNTLSNLTIGRFRNRGDQQNECDQYDSLHETSFPVDPQAEELYF